MHFQHSGIYFKQQYISEARQVISNITTVYFRLRIIKLIYLLKIIVTVLKKTKIKEKTLPKTDYNITYKTDMNHMEIMTKYLGHKLRGGINHASIRILLVTDLVDRI